MENEFDFSNLSSSDVGLDVTSVLTEKINGEQSPPPVKKEEGDDPNKDKPKVEDNLNPLDVLNTEAGKVPGKEEKEVNGEDDKTKAPPQKNKPNDIPFSLVLKSLNEEGAISEFDEETFAKELGEVGAAQALVNVFAKEADVIRQSLRAEQEEDFKEYAALKDLGIDSNTAQALISSKIEFERIKPEELDVEGSEELRREILITNFKNSTNWTDSKIKKQVDLIIDSGKDVEEAKEALDGIKEFNKKQIELAKEAKIKEEADKVNKRNALVKSYTEFIDKLEEPVPGVKINKQTRDTLKNKVLNGSIWEIRNQDPIKFDTLVTYFIEKGGLEGKFDKPAAKAKSSAIAELENVIGSSKKNNEGYSIPAIDSAEEELANSLARSLGVK